MLIASLLCLPLIPADATPPGVLLSEVLPDPGSDREFVEVWNSGELAVGLSGWILADGAGQQFVFPDHTLEPGARVVVWGGGEATPGSLVWSRATVWNNGGDAATLRDASGAVVDWMAYGDHGQTPPPGFSDPGIGAPATGVALQRSGDTWQEGEPSPGTADGAGATVTVQVENVPPSLQWGNVPQQAMLGAEVVLEFLVSDDNGDPVTWELTDDAGTVAAGDAGDHAVSTVAPQQQGPWSLRLVASDGSTESILEHTVQVLASPLAVELPSQGLTFPSLVPGADNVTTTHPFLIRNMAGENLRPHLDLAPLAGPGGSSIAATGNLWVGVGAAGALLPEQWVPYEGPLTALPALGAGEAQAVWLRIAQVPVPLAAGSYGTSFAVVS